MAGPARNHSFFDSIKYSLKKSRTPLMGGMSSAPAVKVMEEKEVFEALEISDCS